MADENEADWQFEFDRLGEDQVIALVRNGLTLEPKKHAAFRWLGQRMLESRAREERTFKYVRWAFYAAVAAVIVGTVGILVAVLLAFLYTGQHGSPRLMVSHGGQHISSLILKRS